jgi:hypothetical protein
LVGFYASLAAYDGNVFGQRGQLGAAKLSLNPRGFSTAIQNGPHAHDIHFDAAVDGEGKAFTQTSVISEDFRVNAAVNT